MPAVQHAGQQHVRQVSAGHQQHQADRRPNQQQRRADTAGDLAREWDDVRAHRAIRTRMLAREPRGEGAHFRLGLLFRHSRPQPRDHFQGMVLTGFGQAGFDPREWQPNVCPCRKCLPAGDHPNHRERQGFQPDGSSDNPGVGRELPAPQFLADQSHRLFPVLVGGAERAAQQRLNTHGGEQIASGAGALDHFRFTLPDQRNAVDGLERVRSHLREAASLRAPILKVGHGHLQLRQHRRALPHLHQSLRLVERQGP